MKQVTFHNPEHGFCVLCVKACDPACAGKLITAFGQQMFDVIDATPGRMRQATTETLMRIWIGSRSISMTAPYA